jgi:hypothetical protein
MINIKLRAWNDIYNFFTTPILLERDNLNLVDERGFLLSMSTGITSPCGREIWFGDFYYNAGYGNLHINTMSDIYILLDGLSENDIGEYLGNEYQNPELIKDES